MNEVQVSVHKPKEQSRRLSPKHRDIMVLWNLGYSIQELAKIYKNTESNIRTIVNKTKSQEYLDLLKTEDEKVFQNLFSKAIKVIKDGLDSVDPKVALAASALWFKASGRLTSTIKVEHTAEDIVKQLMEEAERRSKSVGLDQSEMHPAWSAEVVEAALLEE